MAEAARGPEIYADFQKVDDEDRLVLSTIGTQRDLDKAGIALQDGLELLFWCDDLDDDGQRDDLLVEGTVLFDTDRDRWVAAVDWGRLRHRSGLPAS